MRTTFSRPILCALALLVSLTPLALGQSVRCARPVLSEVQLQDALGYAMLDAQAMAVARNGADKAGELVLVDVSDPMDAQIRSSIAIPTVTSPSSASGRSPVAASGDHVFAVSAGLSSTTLSVIDAADLDNPELAHQFVIPHRVNNITVWDSSLYMMSSPLAGGASRLIVYDIADPASPVLLRSVSMGVMVEAFIVEDERMFVQTDDRVFLHTIDQLGQNQWRSTMRFDSVLAFDVVGDTLLACADDALRIISYANPAAPVEVAEFAAYQPQGVHAIDDVAYVKNGNNQIVTVDITIPARPFSIGRIFSPSPVSLVAPVEDGFIVADGAGMTIFEAETGRTSQPPRQKLTSLAGDPKSFAVYGNYALIINSGQDVIDVVDITDPFAPQFVRSVITTDVAHAIAVNGTHAYVAVGSGFDVYSLADPRNPTWVVTRRHFPYTNITVRGTRLAACSDYNAFNDTNGVVALYDLTNPASPVFLDSIEDLVEPVAMRIRGTHLYCTDQTPARIINGQSLPPHFRFVSIDIFAPGPLAISDEYAEVGSTELTGEPQTSDIAVAADIAYVAANTSGVLRFDVSDPTSMIRLDDIQANADVTKLDVADDMLAFDAQGLYLYDVADPDSPRLLGAAASPFNTQPRAFDPIIDGDTIIATVRQGGLWSVDIGPCGGVCPADLNKDGALNFFDVNLFLNAFNNQDPAADFNDDGSYNFFDINLFLTAFNAGCT